MGNYVVLLRAVNVAGKNKVNMKNLQAALQEVGFKMSLLISKAATSF